MRTYTYICIYTYMICCICIYSNNHIHILLHWGVGLIQNYSGSSPRDVIPLCEILLCRDKKIDADVLVASNGLVDGSSPVFRNGYLLVNKDNYGKSQSLMARLTLINCDFIAMPNYRSYFVAPKFWQNEVRMKFNIDWCFFHDRCFYASVTPWTIQKPLAKHY